LEETVRSLVETQVLEGEGGRYRLTKPVESFQVPTSVQTLLAARIDRLSAEDKHLLQVAAVLGKEAPYALLRTVAELPDDALHRQLTSLQAAEFVYETQQREDPGYSFKHALTQEVAYAGLLHERRRQLHARIVDAIEQLSHDRLDQHIERLAHHALQGRLGEKALHYLQQAGLRAFARSAPQDARTWFEQAFSVLETLPKTKKTLEMAFEIGTQLQLVLHELTDIPQALALLPSLGEVADRLDDDTRRGRVCSIRTITSLMLGELDQGQQAASQGLEIAGRVGDRSLAGLISSYLVWGHFLKGEYRQAVDLATTELAATPVPAAKTGPAPVWTRAWLLASLTALGEFVAAADQADWILGIIQEPRNAHTLGIAYATLAGHRLSRAEWENAHLLNEQCIAAFRTGNVLVNLRNPLANSALILALLGRQSQALERQRETRLLLERLAKTGLGATAGMAHHILSRASLVLGHLDEARTLAELALEGSHLQFGVKANALYLLGSISARPERLDVDQTKAYFHESMALAKPRGMRPLIARCQFGLGKVYRHIGQSEQAHEHFVTAMSMYHEMGLHWGHEQAEANS
jgi:tetratricopeptide (TPR) repeat protein